MILQPYSLRRLKAGFCSGEQFIHVEIVLEVVESGGIEEMVYYKGTIKNVFLEIGLDCLLVC